MELSATGKVILGMLAARPRSGYEIKQLVDTSARFFWAASYGQIYPELKRLEKAGLITGADSSQGSRQRTVFKLTAKGRRAAREWIAGAPGGLRDAGRGTAELFFAGSIEPDRAAEIARERAASSTADRRPSFARSRELDREAPRPEGPRRARTRAR